MKRIALFDYGFRPFFLLAGLYAALLAPWWLHRYVDGASGALPGMYWHAHEMLFGFVAAAIAGFLLTAVPSWTGSRGFAGAPLILLTASWLLGRVAMSELIALPFWLRAGFELSFFPVLVALLAPALLRAHNRNTPFLGILGALWLLDAAYLVALHRSDAALAARTLTVTIDLIAVLVTVIGGRIVPSFTGNALRQTGQTAQIVSRRQIDIAVISLMIAIAIADLLGVRATISGALAAIVAVLHAIRLAGWRGWRAPSLPIVWVLHIAYAWLPIAFAMKAAWLLLGAQWAMKWQHALTMGVFATMILAVMTRASLGHTGRPIQATRGVAFAYGVLTLGVALRLAAAFSPQYYLTFVIAAGACWTLSFLLFIAVYGPILLMPRLDGRSG